MNVSGCLYDKGKLFCCFVHVVIFIMTSLENFICKLSYFIATVMGFCMFHVFGLAIICLSQFRSKNICHWFAMYTMPWWNSRNILPLTCVSTDNVWRSFLYKYLYRTVVHTIIKMFVLLPYMLFFRNKYKRRPPSVDVVSLNADNIDKWLLIYFTICA